MSDNKIPGNRGGGTLTPWKKGQSGNPKGRTKGINSWIRKLSNSKKFEISLEVEDDEGEVQRIFKSVTLKKGVAELAAVQLLLKAASGDMDAIREMVKLDCFDENRPKEEEKEKQRSESVPYTIIDPAQGNKPIQLDIGGAD